MASNTKSVLSHSWYFLYNWFSVSLIVVCILGFKLKAFRRDRDWSSLCKLIVCENILFVLQWIQLFFPLHGVLYTLPQRPVAAPTLATGYEAVCCAALLAAGVRIVGLCGLPVLLKKKRVLGAIGIHRLFYWSCFNVYHLHPGIVR